MSPVDVVLLVVPCYNEAARLDATAFTSMVDEIAGLNFLFVDDGSHDGTAEIHQRLCSARPGRIASLTLQRNQGKAEAVRQGLLRALAGPAAGVGYLDADLATPPSEVQRLCALFQGQDCFDVLLASNAIDLEGIYTHFSVADGSSAEDRVFTLESAKGLEEWQNQLKQCNGFSPLIISGRSDQIGIVTVHEGPSLPPGELIAPAVGTDKDQPNFHNNYQDIEAFLRAGWDMRPGLAREIDGLPLHVHKEDGESRAKPCAEVLMTEEGADAIGANCGVGIAEYVAICRRLRAATTLPVWIKANAGLPEMIEGRTEYRTGPAQFASHIPALIREGANFVGGCCGTSPEFIRAAAGALAEACA